MKPLLDLKVRLESIVRVSDQAIVAQELLLRPVAGGCVVDHAARAHIDMAWVTGYALEAAGAVLEHAVPAAPREHHARRPGAARRSSRRSTARSRSTASAS